MSPEFKTLLKAQLAAWPLDKKASAKTMAPYYQAIEVLCQEMIASTEISTKIPLETLFLTFEVLNRLKFVFYFLVLLFLFLIQACFF